MKFIKSFLAYRRAVAELNSFDTEDLNDSKRIGLKSYAEKVLDNKDLVQRYPLIIEKILSKYKKLHMGAEMPSIASKLVTIPSVLYGKPFLVGRLVNLCDSDVMPQLFDELNKGKAFFRTYPDILRTMVARCDVSYLVLMTDKIVDNNLLDCSMGKYIIRSHPADCGYVPEVLRIIHHGEKMQTAIAKHAIDKIFSQGQESELLSESLESLGDSFILTPGNGFLGYVFNKLKTPALKELHSSLPESVKSVDWVDSLYREALDRSVVRKDINANRASIRIHTPKVRKINLDGCTL